jgi:hypothetical protein
LHFRARRSLQSDESLFFVDLSQHRARKITHHTPNSLFLINKIASLPHDARSSKSIRTEERQRGNEMAKAAAKTKTTAAKKKAPAKKPAAKKRAAKRA